MQISLNPESSLEDQVKFEMITDWSLAPRELLASEFWYGCYNMLSQKFWATDSIQQCYQTLKAVELTHCCGDDRQIARYLRERMELDHVGFKVPTEEWVIGLIDQYRLLAKPYDEYLIENDL